MRKIIVFLIVGFLFAPAFSLAEGVSGSCSQTGYTILTLNGILVNEREAQVNKEKLEKFLEFSGGSYNDERLFIDYLHNPSHLAGLGDIVKAIKQKIEGGATTDDYDLVEMLRDASEKVKTRKLLLVAHSQGNFYANSFYDKVVGKDGGVPAESIGLYSVATPADRVAGGGRYLTSETDKVIAGLVGSMPFYRIMPPNTTIELGDGDDALGHSFAGVYLKYKGVEIVSGVEESLAKLEAVTPSSVSPLEMGRGENPPSPTLPQSAGTPPLGKEELNRRCIEAPELTIAHKAAGIAFAIADPVASAGLATLSGTIKGIARIGTAVVEVGRFVMEKVAGALSSNTTTVVNQNAAAAVLTVSEQSTTNDPPPITEEQILRREDATPPLTREEVKPTAPGPSSKQITPREQHTDKLENVRVSQQPIRQPTTPELDSRVRLPAQADGNDKEKRGNDSRQSGREPSPYFRLAPPGGGGGGIRSPQQPTPTNFAAGQATADTTAPSAPTITSPSTTAASTTTTVAFTGTAEAGAVISTSFSSATVTVGASGAWSLTLTLLQGTTTLQVFATDTAGNRSGAADYSVFVDSLAPSTPTVTSPSSTATTTATSVAFSGTAEAGSVISTSFSSATVTASGPSTSSGQATWSLTLSLSQGTNALVFYATDSAGNRSVAATKTVAVDSLSPDASLSDASECADTLVSGSCFVATTTLSWSWSSGASDLAYFALSKNGTYATTTSTSLSVTAADQSAYSFSIAAVDSAGNRSATTTKTATIFLMPVVVNEVAWAGTQGSSADEWIELYNRTSETLSLSNWTLYADDLSPYLALSGTIAPASYYLIERKNTGETNEATQSSVIGVTADLWASFGLGLKNAGSENLTLAYKTAGRATTTVDYVPKCGSNWCGGSDSTYTTMERYDASVAGTVSANWYSHLGLLILNGTDVGGSAIKGTPKARNSVSFLIEPAADRVLSANKTLSSANSPYLIDSAGLTVPSGRTLTIPAGVVVKIYAPSNEFLIQGTINANGTAASPVVFTSFLDDEYGGDLNADGSATTPAAGNWRRIFVDTTSAGSSFTQTLVRYGGNNDISNPAAKKGAIGVNSATVTFNGLIVEKSGFYGLSLANSGSTVSNSRFSTSTDSSVSASGLYIFGGSPTVSGNIFSGNYRGITIESATPTVSSNTFIGNTQEAIYTTGTIGGFSGNSGSGNGVNAIVIGNGTTITAGGATTTLAANSTGATALPYLVKNAATVTGNSTLSFSAGAVVKGYIGSSYGELVVQNGGKIHSSGTTASDIVFTSVLDASVGGTTVSGTASAGDWNGITVEAGGTVDLTGFTLKYGGHKADTGFPVMGENAGALKITGSSGSSGRIAQALFDQNYQSGLNLANVSALSVSDTTFSNHTLERLGNASGLYASQSTSTLANITFSGNEKDAVGAVGTVNFLSCTSCTPASPATSPANLFTQ